MGGLATRSPVEIGEFVACSTRQAVEPWGFRSDDGACSGQSIETGRCPGLYPDDEASAQIDLPQEVQNYDSRTNSLIQSLDRPNWYFSSSR